MQKRELKAEISQPQRLDVFLTDKLDFTRSYIKKLIDEGRVTLGGIKVKSGKTVKDGDIVEVEIPDPVMSGLIAEDIPLDILYEDNDIIVINKQQGLTVHPGGGAHTGTLANALMHRFGELSAINGVMRPGIVHRLDKNTSGVMVAAKNDKAHLSLSRQISARKTKKIYHAILEGVLKTDSGTLKTCIGRNPKDRKSMCVLPTGREAISIYRVLQRFESNTLAEFEILTGRTHQIRVHAKYLCHPVTGDPVYGYKKQRFSSLQGQLLHSYSLEFTHPSTKERLKFTAPYPEHFLKVLQILKKELVE